MKRIILIICVLCAGCLVVLGQNSMTLVAENQEISQSQLETDAAILSRRLSSYGVSHTIRVVPDSHGLVISSQDDLDGGVIAMLSSRKGMWKISAVADRNDFFQRMDHGDLVFGVLDTVLSNSSISLGSENHVLGRCSVSQMDKLMEHLSRLQDEGVLEGFAVAQTFPDRGVSQLLVLQMPSDSNHILSNRDVVKASMHDGKMGKSIGIEFTDVGADKFFRLTKSSIGKTLVIHMDGQVIMAPVVKDEISGGKVEISMSDHLDHMFLLALISTGPLINSYQLLR